ncbi:HoxN/HupN/NixA family nickel/cobalt transporter [Actinocrinis puniceicyclus]|uniref:Nickel/cobalt efflux system n=1 Tax=Actinocrinis puniceicyclus TaxID=977794 RepID=A0A8J7WQ22_9ACTN|nr:HoxN/HupN/NixA family nickel/cobalt transporter [Actinocrinis puniceicyclus]
MHALAFGVLALLVAPHHYAVGKQVFGFGLGLTAYTLGMRHAFDADHIAAIDNTTRKLMAEGKRPISVGFWFALGHSTVVVLLAALIAAGAREATALTGQTSDTHRTLEIIGTGASGVFLYLIGLLNLAALVGIARLYRAARAGAHDEAALDQRLARRGLLNRLLGRLTRSVGRPGQMYPIGLLFGVGFDTASEVLLLGMAAGSAAAGLPWYAIVCLPLLFAAGMSLFDTLDGTFMNFAYHWAFAHPVRKIYYNLAVTGLSVTVALVVGTVELVGVAHDRFGLRDPVSGWVAGLDLNNVGFLIVGAFAAVWAAALAYWKLAGVERRWSRALGAGEKR